MSSTSQPLSAFSLPQDTPNARLIFLILGLACITGFVLNIVAAAVPPDPMALEWRTSFMQQISGRGILLFLGLAMLTYSLLDWSAILRLVALATLITGLFFVLSGVLVIRDSLVVQEQTLGNIEREVTEIRSQLETAQASPNLPEGVTPAQINQALVQLSAQAEELTQNARSTTTKAMMSVLSTQVVLGVGMLALGRFSVRASSNH